MNYAGRIETLRTEMQDKGVAGVFLPLDASFEYFTGAKRSTNINTRIRQNSAEYASLLITEKDVVYFNSRLTAMEMMASIGQYPTITRAITFPDADLSGDTFVSACIDFGLKGKTLAHLQDTTSSIVLRLQKDLEAAWVNFDPVVQGMRAVKDSEELALMRKAAEINDKIYSAVFTRLVPGTAVAEIAREIDKLVLSFGADATSFHTSVMNFGPLEGDGYGDRYPVLRRGYTVSFDYGVLYKGYCSDFGRTVFFGEPDGDMVKAHELVMSAQKAGIAAMRAGKVNGEELNLLARQVIIEGGYDEEFTHRLGHGIGKDVHERPFLAEGEKRVLETGMCFTVEPSILLPRRGMLRVEDVVMATPEGGENFNSTTWDLVVIE